MASRRDPLDALARFTQALDVIDPFEGIEWNEGSKEECSVIIWPRYNKMIEIWRDLVRDMLKEAIEEILNSPSLSPTEAVRLRGLIERCLLPTSPESVIPIFSRIDSILGEISGMAQNTALIIHSNSKEFGVYDFFKETKSTPFIVDTHDALDDLVRMYYGMHCFMSGTNPAFFDSLGDTCPMLKKEGAKLFERKKLFQDVYGKLPGDFLHYFFKCVCTCKPDDPPYIHPNACKNLQRFLRELAPRLHSAIRQSVQHSFNL